MKTMTMMCAVCSDQFETKSHRSKFALTNASSATSSRAISISPFSVRSRDIHHDKRLKYCSVECRAIAKVIRSY